MVPTCEVKAACVSWIPCNLPAPYSTPGYSKIKNAVAVQTKHVSK